MTDCNSGMSDARRFLLAVGGGLLFSLACLTVALRPANADCFCTTAASHDGPTLL